MEVMEKLMNKYKRLSYLSCIFTNFRFRDEKRKCKIHPLFRHMMNILSKNNKKYVVVILEKRI